MGMRPFNGVGERFRHQPWGLHGGAAGASGQFRIRDEEGERRLEDKSGDIQIAPKTRIVIETPGAGGLGAPEQRDIEAVEHDQCSGKFSSSYIKKYYYQI